MPTTPPHGPAPDGKITAFDRGQYDKLINWVDSVDQDLNVNLAKPRAGVRLDANLGSGIFVGSDAWAPAKRLVDQAKLYGTSVEKRYADLTKDWEQYVAALRNARDVFETTNNLSNYDASKFVTQYPDVNPSTHSGGGSSSA